MHISCWQPQLHIQVGSSLFFCICCNQSLPSWAIWLISSAYQPQSTVNHAYLIWTKLWSDGQWPWQNQKFKQLRGPINLILFGWFPWIPFWSVGSLGWHPTLPRLLGQLVAGAFEVRGTITTHLEPSEPSEVRGWSHSLTVDFALRSACMYTPIYDVRVSVDSAM